MAPRITLVKEFFGRTVCQKGVRALSLVRLADGRYGLQVIRGHSDPLGAYFNRDQIIGIAEDILKEAKRWTSDWMVKAYDGDDKVIETFVIEDRTEREAESEASGLLSGMAGLEDWTMTRVSEES